MNTIEIYKMITLHLGGWGLFFIVPFLRAVDKCKIEAIVENKKLASPLKIWSVYFYAVGIFACFSAMIHWGIK